MITKSLIAYTIASFLAMPLAALGQETASLSVAALGRVPSTIGLAPEDVYKRYGRPVKVEQAELGGFGILGDERITLIQYYDVVGGGRVGFLFRRQYYVAGILFDNLHSSRYLLLSDFFLSVPGTVVRESCIQSDAFHSMPGDEYDYGSVPLTTMVATTTRSWATSTGGLFFARYRLDGHVRHVYDVTSGNDRLMPPLRLDDLHLLEFAWLPSPGRNEIGDAHPGPDMNFTTLTTSYPETPCYSGSGAPIH